MLTEVRSDLNELEPGAPPAAVAAHNEIRIDICEVAGQAFASLALVFTNSILTITLGVSKLTGFTIISSLAIGWLTKPLHSANTTLARQTYAPIRHWAEALERENNWVIETRKVVALEGNRLIFYPERYGEHFFDSLKMVVAPISLALSIVNAALWIAIKPIFLLVIPEMLITIPLALNKGISCLTYSPLQQLSDKMLDLHCDCIRSLYPGLR